MSAHAAAVEPAAVAPPAPRSRSLFAGAWLLSASMVLAGLLTYAFQVLAARTLGPTAYGEIAVLWGAMFLGAVVLYRPLEQTMSRAIADRVARGDEVRTVLRAVAAISAYATALVVVA